MHSLHRGKKTKQNVCPGYDTEISLVVMLIFKRSVKCRELLCCHYSQIHSVGMEVIVKILSMF